MTMNGVMALILCYFTEFGSFRWAQCVKVVEGQSINIRLLRHDKMQANNVKHEKYE